MIAAVDADLWTKHHVVADDNLGPCCAKGGPFAEGYIIATVYVLEGVIPVRIEVEMGSAPAKAIAVHDDEEAMDHVPDQGMDSPQFHGRLIENLTLGIRRKTSA
jgi:hypothetical protein